MRLGSIKYFFRLTLQVEITSKLLYRLRTRARKSNACSKQLLIWGSSWISPVHRDDLECYCKRMCNFLTTLKKKKKKKAKSRGCLEGRAVPPFGYRIKPSGQVGECGVSRIFPVTPHSPNRQSLSSYTDQFEQKYMEVVWGPVFYKTRCQRAVNRYKHRPSTATSCKIQGNWLPQDKRLKIEPAWSAVQCSSSRKSDIIASSACWVMCSQGIFLKHFTLRTGNRFLHNPIRTEV